MKNRLKSLVQDALYTKRTKVIQREQLWAILGSESLSSLTTVRRLLNTVMK
ncbi:hypothetical protein H8S64_06785 [Butyricimonas sp. NSJ-56]|uniref:Uncharacterized protein n=1 Tax=Butyricimonas hominis TaxID=2763032 RepID=A0ABR7CYQ1_9BACT|nr:hypothetical protein [Butyricimonas hominis]